MKRKILSVILVLMILPLGFVLFACKDKKEYKLNGISEDFNSIEEISENVVINDGVVYFDYSIYEDESEGIQYLNNEINKSNSPYSSLTAYGQIFVNSMNFSKIYLGKISSLDNKVDKATHDKIINSLNIFKDNVKTVSNRIDSLAQAVNFYKTNLDNTTCLIELKTLYKKYAELISSSIKFNKTLSDYYFNDVLSLAKIDYSTTKIEDLDITKALINLQTRLDMQVVCLTETYLEMYIIGDTTADSLVTKVDDNYGGLGLNFIKYSVDINKIKNKTISLDIVEEINNNLNNLKTKFYEQNLELYNIQSALENDYDIFINATNNVCYNDIVSDKNSTEIQKAYANSINSYYYLVEEYTNSLCKMLSLLRI